MITTKQEYLEELKRTEEHLATLKSMADNFPDEPKGYLYAPDIYDDVFWINVCGTEDCGTIQQSDFVRHVSDIGLAFRTSKERNHYRKCLYTRAELLKYADWNGEEIAYYPLLNFGGELRVFHSWTDVKNGLGFMSPLFASREQCEYAIEQVGAARIIEMLKPLQVVAHGGA